MFKLFVLALSFLMAAPSMAKLPNTQEASLAANIKADAIAFYEDCHQLNDDSDCTIALSAKLSFDLHEARLPGIEVSDNSSYLEGCKQRKSLTECLDDLIGNQDALNDSGRI